MTHHHTLLLLKLVAVAQLVSLALERSKLRFPLRSGGCVERPDLSLSAASAVVIGCVS